MTPGKYNMICPQGATFAKQLTYAIDGDPVDLTTYTARMQVREKHTSKTIVVNLTTENDGIVLGDETGTIDLYISDEATSAITAKDYVYDLELISSGEVYRLLEGKFIVTPEVTR
jgi:DNA/RNA endonuclease YhcR with UshA esterase domain